MKDLLKLMPELIQAKIISAKHLNKVISTWNLQHLTQVFTNGCFDILHPGHIFLLNKAASLGNKLIIGLNSDASVSRLKGNSRPINDWNSRAVLLASLSCVDFIVPFEEDTPLELIKSIKPNILVKGGDYQADEVVGASEMKEWGGIISIIPFLEGFSTSSLLKNGL